MGRIQMQSVEEKLKKMDEKLTKMPSTESAEEGAKLIPNPKSYMVVDEYKSNKADDAKVKEFKQYWTKWCKLLFLYNHKWRHSDETGSTETWLLVPPTNKTNVSSFCDKQGNAIF